MKQITNNTKLIIESTNIVYNAVIVNGVIYWIDKKEILNNSWYENNGVLFLSDPVYNDGNNPNNSNPRVTNFNRCIIAQSENILDGVPVISLKPKTKEEFAAFFIEKANHIINNIGGGEKWNRYQLKDEILDMFLNVSDVVQKDYILTSENQYSQKDIEKAIKLSKTETRVGTHTVFEINRTNEQIIEQLNQISVIKVDDKFNIISYE